MTMRGVKDTDLIASCLHLAKYRALSYEEHAAAIRALHRVEKKLGIWDLTAGDKKDTDHAQEL